MRIIAPFILVLLSATSVYGQANEHLWLQSRMTGNYYFPDLSSTEFWGYGLYTPPTPGPQIYLPGPLLRFNQGDTVNVHFLNNSPEQHTIHWHGLDVDQANDGVPTTSSSVDPDSLRIYSFVCTNAGTFNYHCHVLTTLHLAMGMYGLFIVDPDSTRTRIYTNGPRYTKDYNWLSSEMNRNWNDNTLSPGLFTLYEATHVLLNGKSGSQLTTGAYDITGTTDDTIAVRLSNMGYGSVKFIFPPEANMSIHMSDGRAIPAPIVSDTIELFSGERYTVLLNPDMYFTSTVQIEYTDQRTNLPIGTNVVPIIIQGASLDELEGNDLFELIGNPVTEFLTLNVKSNEVKEIEIHNMMGQRVVRSSVNSGINVLPSFLAPGMYIIRSPQVTGTIRFIQQ